jgi:integrase
MAGEQSMNHSITPPTSMSCLAQRYLDDRRRLGFSLKIAGHQLLAFARFADRSGHRGLLSKTLILSWVRSRPRKSSVTWPRWIEIIRPFAKYLQQFDPSVEVPDTHLFGRGHRRLTPHIYTEQEICILLRSAEELGPKGSLRPLTYCCLFGLIAVTGLRISEALNLRRSDVDLNSGTLTVRRTKFQKSRLVPTHLSTTQMLRDYDIARGQAVANVSDSFFVCLQGFGLKNRTVHGVFERLRAHLGWTARGGHPHPRIHDLRHSLICHRIEHWYRQRINVDHAIVSLSTYVGHMKVTDTYWYLTGIPDLMAIVAGKFERFAQGGQHV